MKRPTKRQLDATFAVMWLCAQPQVAKHIRKLANPLAALAKRRKEK